MPRSEWIASTTLQNRISQSPVFIVYAVKIHWDTGGGAPLRLCSAGSDMTETGSSEVYTGVGLRVSGGNMNSLTGKYDLTIPDENGTVAGYLINQGKGVACQIYQCYIADNVTTQFALTEGYFLMDGIVTGAPMVKNNFVVQISVARDAANRLTPIMVVGKPTNNWNTPVGTRTNVSRFFVDVVE